VLKNCVIDYMYINSQDVRPDEEDLDQVEPDIDDCEDGIESAVSPYSLIKHPLQNKWALWFFKNDRTKEWTANLKLITAFDTVEDFWA